MCIHGLPDMYTRDPHDPWASGVATYQTSHECSEGFGCTYQASHECTWYNCYVPYSPSPGRLEAAQAKKHASLQDHCQCIAFIVEDTHFNCGFWYHFCIASIII